MRSLVRLFGRRRELSLELCQVACSKFLREHASLGSLDAGNELGLGEGLRVLLRESLGVNEADSDNEGSAELNESHVNLW